MVLHHRRVKSLEIRLTCAVVRQSVPRYSSLGGTACHCYLGAYRIHSLALRRLQPRCLLLALVPVLLLLLQPLQPLRSLQQTLYLLALTLRWLFHLQLKTHQMLNQNYLSIIKTNKGYGSRFKEGNGLGYVLR